MERNALADRIKKINKNTNTNDEKKSSTAKIFSAREQNHLKIRKVKLDDGIMKNRMLIYLKNSSDGANKYAHLHINKEEFVGVLPDFLEEEFGVYDQKLERIQFYFEDYLELIKTIPKSNILNDEEMQTKITKEAYMRYGVMKLSVMTTNKDLRKEDEDEITTELIEYLVRIFLISSDFKLLYEITQILINVTYNYNKFTNTLIEAELMNKILKLAETKEPALVLNSVWIIGNLIENEEMCGIITNIIPNLFVRLNELMQEYSNILIHTDVISIITWTVYRILFSDADHFENFVSSIPVMVSILESEIDKALLVLEEKIETDISEYENFEEIIKNILLIFGKITATVTEDDEEPFIKMINSSLMLNLLKLIDPYSKIACDNYYQMVFRIIGGLITSPVSTHTEIVLSYDLIGKMEKVLEWFLLHNYYNRKILKEMAWTVSNITAGTAEQIDKVILKSQLPGYFLAICKTFRDPLYLKEVIYLFYNVIDYGSPQAKQQIQSDEVIDFVISCLDAKETVLSLLKIALDYIHNLIQLTKNTDFDLIEYKSLKKRFEVKNLTVVLENLQYHDNKEISSLADVIVMDTWDYEEQCFYNENFL